MIWADFQKANNLNKLRKNILKLQILNTIRKFLNQAVVALLQTKHLISNDSV